MTLDWQTLFALACVAWAAVVVLRRAWRLVRPGAGSSCSGCHGGCAGDVVPLELPTDGTRSRNV